MNEKRAYREGKKAAIDAVIASRARHLADNKAKSLDNNKENSMEIDAYRFIARKLSDEKIENLVKTVDAADESNDRISVDISDDKGYTKNITADFDEKDGHMSLHVIRGSHKKLDKDRKGRQKSTGYGENDVFIKDNTGKDIKVLAKDKFEIEKKMIGLKDSVLTPKEREYLKFFNGTKFGYIDSYGKYSTKSYGTDSRVPSASKFEKDKVGSCLARAIYLQYKLGYGRIFGILDRKNSFGHFVFVNNDNIAIDPKYGTFKVDSIDSFTKFYKVKNPDFVGEVKVEDLIDIPYSKIWDVILGEKTNLKESEFSDDLSAIFKDAFIKSPEEELMDKKAKEYVSEDLSNLFEDIKIKREYDGKTLEVELDANADLDTTKHIKSGDASIILSTKPGNKIDIQVDVATSIKDQNDKNIKKFDEKLPKDIKAAKEAGVPENLAEVLFDGLSALSSKNIGAFMAFEKDKDLEKYCENGEKIDAPISEDILMSIFYPGTKVHDGACVVKDGIIKYASVFFKNVSSDNFAEHYGARHRTAMGLSKDTDAFCIVVSEETGNISFAIDGKLTVINAKDVDKSREKFIKLFNENINKEKNIKEEYTSLFETAILELKRK